MATENMLMAAVQAGGDRQDLHERIRVHALAAAERLKDGAADNDLIERIRTIRHFPPLDFERGARPAAIYRPVGAAGRRVSWRARSSRSAGAILIARAVDEDSRGPRVTEKRSEVSPVVRDALRGARPVLGNRRCCRSQTREVWCWRALRNRFSSSRRRRSLGFS